MQDFKPREARKLCLSSQLLSGDIRLSQGKEGVAYVIEKLGYVQIDTISVVERAHHHTIWTRIPDYSPGMLDQLQSVDRRIFEYWGHAASYLPMSDYRFYTHRMKNFSDPMDKWAKDRLEKCGHLMDGVLERIRNEGPLGSRDFKSNPDAKRGQWWDWKPAKIALELLFWRGDLMVSRRINFHRIYDLTERVLPRHVITTEPSHDELGRFLVRRALSSYGIATRRQIISHIHAASGDVITEALNELVSQGEVLSATIDGDSGYYVLPDVLSYIDPPENPGIHILSPFDNLIIQRERISRLFNFDYVLECYMPSAKRKYGYFVMPLLWGHRFIGRLDPKADRKKGKLIIRSIHLEPGTNIEEDMLTALASRLWSFAGFNGCREIELESTFPKSLKSPLAKLLKKQEGD